MGMTIAGNGCLFCFFILFALLLCVMGILYIAMGIWLYVKLKETYVFNIGCVVLGVVIALYSLLACCLRVSKVRLVCFNIGTSIWFLANLAVCIGWWVKKQEFIQYMQTIIEKDPSATDAYNLAVSN